MAEKNTQKNTAPVNKQSYHFSGETIYVPISIEASSYEEALELWKTQRVPVAGYGVLKANAPVDSALQDKKVVE